MPAWWSYSADRPGRHGAQAATPEKIGNRRKGEEYNNGTRDILGAFMGSARQVPRRAGIPVTDAGAICDRQAGDHSCCRCERRLHNSNLIKRCLIEILLLFSVYEGGAKYNLRRQSLEFRELSRCAEGRDCLRIFPCADRDHEVQFGVARKMVDISLAVRAVMVQCL
jgi:hypothetical protein